MPQVGLPVVPPTQVFKPSELPSEEVPQASAAVSAPTELGVPGGELALAQDSAPLLDDREHYLARVDHRATVGRMRTLVPAAAIGWIAFFSLDLVIALWVFPTDVLPFFLLRLAGLVVLLTAGFILRRTAEPSPALLTGLDTSMMVATAGCISLMGLFAGGVASPYHAFVVLVMLGRAAVLPHRWQEGMWRLAIPALVDPLVLGIASLAVPSIGAQWLDPAARGTYVFYAALLIGAWTLVVLGSHHAWALRRQVFASRNLGRFKLRHRIGKGGMGEVWIARDEQLRRDVALKVLRPSENQDEEAVARFEREIRATAALRHPNTIRIFSHGVSEDGLWYYAMELLEGETLQGLVQRVGPLPPERAVSLLHQAARALSEAHARGIVHRDIKPENLFVTALGGEADVIKVLDFGIVRMSEDEVGLTGTGFVAGTPTYMSPEVATGETATASADVYALGATLYFALTGGPPFEGPDAASVLRQHVNTPTPRLASRMRTPIDPGLEQVCMCALAKDPQKRFESAADFAAALEGAKPTHPRDPSPAPE